MKDVSYTLRIGPTENAYHDNLGKVVVFRGASLPNVCVGCGGPAWGNTYHKDVEPLMGMGLPGPFLAIYFIIGKRYLLDFPFCPTCPPDNFQLSIERINEDFAIFSDTSTAFLKSLPPLPSDLEAQVSVRRIQRMLEHFRK